MITIKGLSRKTFRNISKELETDRWWDASWEHEQSELISVRLDSRVIIKVYDENEVMIDLAGEKTFITPDEFEEISII